MASNDIPESSRITGIVLDGGRGTRMGGVNKGLVEYQGRYLFEYSVDNLSNHVNAIVINSNTDHSVFRQLGFQVFDDGDYLYQGPLAGIYAAMCSVNTPYIAIAPCDQLTLPEKVYAELVRQALQSGGAYAMDGVDAHPTCAVLSVTLVNNLQETLASGQLRLMQWVKNNATAVSFPDVNFSNLNTLPEGA